MNILIIGGARFVGPLVVERLVAHSHDVTVFSRGITEGNLPQTVKRLQGDRNNGFSSIKDHFDVVIDTCAYTGEQTKAALEQLSFDFFIHFGTIASYQKTDIFPLSEGDPQGDWPFMGDYGKGKVECEEVLAASGKSHAVIRPTYILGPANYIDRENFIYSRIHAEQPIVLPGNGQALVQFVFAKEVADILVMLAENKTEGAFNCVGNESISLKGLVDHMAELVGKQPKIEYNPAADGEHHNGQEFPFANENMLFTNQKAKDLGVSFTPLLEGLKQDFEAYYKALLK